MERLTRGLLGLILGLVLTVAIAPALAGSFAGEWEGAIQIPGSPLPIVVRLAEEGDRWQGSIDIPLQGISRLPLERIAFDNEEISFSLAGVPGGAKMKGKLQENGRQFAGQLQQGGLSFPFSLERQTAKESEDPLSELRNFITDARSQWQVPGVAVGIVKDGQVILAEGFGYRDLEGKLPVTENTFFAIGSCTKAFTSLLAGMLVEEGKLDLDKPIAEYLSRFAFEADPLSDYITLRDLLSHSAGLPRHDFALIYNPKLTRKGIMDSLRFMRRTGNFRSSFQYSNFNYIIAASLMEEIMGLSWEEALSMRVLKPLGMSSNLSIGELTASSNYALPYLERKGEVERIGFWELGAAAPAGAINASIGDLTRWLNLFLDNGKIGERSLVSSATIQQLTTPQVALSGRGDGRVKHQSYALGWFVDSYRGHYRVYHGGTTAGFSANVTFLPEDGIGIVVLANLQGTPLVEVITQTAIDRLLEFEPVDWNGETRRVYEQQVKLLDELSVFNSSTRHLGTKPSQSLDAYTGTFVHPLYGTISISQKGEGLVAKYYLAELSLLHWHYDTFIGEIDTIGRFQVPLQFITSLDGRIDKLNLGLDPFSSQNLVTFTRQEEIDSSLMKSFVGTYLVAGMQVEVKLGEGDSLFLVVPGQPVYTLVPIGKTRFALREAMGFTVEFGKEGKIVLIQPNGTFEGEKL